MDVVQTPTARELRLALQAVRKAKGQPPRRRYVIAWALAKAIEQHPEPEPEGAK